MKGIIPQGRVLRPLPQICGSRRLFTAKLRIKSGGRFRLDVSAQEVLKISGFSDDDIAEITKGLPDNSSDAGKDKPNRLHTYGIVHK